MRLIRKLIATIKKGFYRIMENVTNAINEATEAKMAKWTFIRETIASVWRTFKSSYMLKIMISLALGGASLALGADGLIEAKEAHAEFKREKELAELDHKIAVNAKLRELEASKNA